MKVAIIVGSLRQGSYNHKLADNIAEALTDIADVEWISPEVPLFCADLEPDAIPGSVTKAAEQVRASDVVVFVSPEYNRSFSGVIKNLIDWLSRESVGYPLDGKLGAIAGASTGPIGTAVMQSQLRPVLSHIGMEILPLPEIFISVPSRMSPDGELTDRSAQALRLFADRLTARISTKYHILSE